MLNRLHLFLALFTFVYFLESIGGSYMISAVQNIERQFHIPSKLSGFLVSAHDLSYVPTVIFISYYGSMGNRAKWIGAGTILIAFAHIFTASPNFFFPVKAPVVNLTEIEERLHPSDLLLSDNASIVDFFHYAPIRDRIPVRVRTLLLHKIGGIKNAADDGFVLPVDEKNHALLQQNHSISLYSVDEPLISRILQCSDSVLRNEEKPNELLNLLREFVDDRIKYADNDLKTMRRAAVAPFAFCHKLVNDLRQALKEVQCHTESSNVRPLLVIFIALLALGVGRTMPWTLGIPLIDDNVKRKSMPVYFAMISFIRIMGPICGFLIGSAANKLYYTFPTKAPRGLTPQDPTWIGAWWLGFLFIGFITIIPSVVLFFFPESSRRKVADKAKNGALAEQGGGSNGDIVKPLNKSIKLSLFDRHVKTKAEKEQSTCQKTKKFLSSYKRVVSSNVYLGTVIGRVMDIMAFKGYMVFLPKYLENHYGIPQYRVHIYMAMFGVLGFACGTACGGFITRRFKLNGRKAAMFVFLISTLNTAIFFSKSFLGCHSTVNGIGKASIDSNLNFNYTRSCNAECACASAKLFPVCDVDGRAFYSPCHAGCRHVDVIDLDKYDLEFSECDCVPGGVVRKEYCQDDCELKKYLFFVTMITSSFIGGTGVVPGMLLLLRSVPPGSRSPALGLQGFAVSLFGTLPSPIIWGAIIDSSCLVWDNVCGVQGSCQIYDPTKLRVRMHVLYVAIRIVSIITDLYVYMHAKGLNIQDDEEKTEKEAENAAGAENVAMDVM